jgi:hypothetical protein
MAAALDYTARRSTVGGRFRLRVMIIGLARRRDNDCETNGRFSINYLQNDTKHHRFSDHGPDRWTYIVNHHVSSPTYVIVYSNIIQLHDTEIY